MLPPQHSAGRGRCAEQERGTSWQQHHNSWQPQAATDNNGQESEVQSPGISPTAGSCFRVAAGGEAAGCSNWGMFFIYLCKELVLAWIGTLMSSGN